MAYTPTTWVDDSEPALNESNLNKIEKGIEDAHELAGQSPSWGSVTGKPSTFPPSIGKSASTAKAGNWNPGISDVSGLEAKIDELESRLSALEGDEPDEGDN